MLTGPLSQVNIHYSLVLSEGTGGFRMNTQTGYPSHERKWIGSGHQQTTWYFLYKTVEFQRLILSLPAILHSFILRTFTITSNLASCISICLQFRRLSWLFLLLYNKQFWAATDSAWLSYLYPKAAVLRPQTAEKNPFLLVIYCPFTMEGTCQYIPSSMIAAFFLLLGTSTARIQHVGARTNLQEIPYRTLGVAVGYNFLLLVPKVIQ